MTVFPKRIIDDKGEALLEGGLSLRDYFATSIVQGLLASSTDGNANVWQVARNAYKVADAMLEVRGE